MYTWGRGDTVKIAAIDLGTNSIHMVIAELTASGGFRLVDRETEAVRLGSRAMSTGVLTASAMDRAMTTLRAYRRLAKIHRVEDIVALATSAVREARNGEDFLRAVGRQTGIWPRAISGEEEAGIIFSAVLHSVHLDGRRAAVVDIGGGSVELILGGAAGVEISASLKLGVLRLTEAFVRADPITTRQERKLLAHIGRALDPVADRIRRKGFDRVVGTSGTILALGRLALAARTGQRPESLHHVTLTVDAVREVKDRLTSLSARDRLKLPGMDRRRVDILPAGAIVLDAVLSRIGAREIVLCDWALREGILLEYAARHRKELARAEVLPDVRRRSVVDLSERWTGQDAHVLHVARLTLDLFDATRRLHGFGTAERELLEYAALLHDVGHHISHRQHHKHSYYLIKNGDLRGFDPAEIEIMASIARYHTGADPSRKHAEFAALKRPDRLRVTVLSGLLRLGESLDRTHRQHVRSVSGVRAGKGMKLRCRILGDAELEIWGANRHLSVLEDALGVPLRLEAVAAAPRRAPRTRATRERRPKRSAGRARTRR